MQYKEWKVDSWKEKKALHQPKYENNLEVDGVVSQLKKLPPIVFEGEIERLKDSLKLAEEGKMFLLQGGDCVERFEDCNLNTIINKVKILLQMSIVVTFVAKKPVIKIGRIAGQYSKPRSREYEEINGITLPSYKGDSINSFSPDKLNRSPNPNRIKESYFHSVATSNFIRSITKGGFANLHNPEKWNLDFIGQTKEKKEYRELIDNVQNSVKFLECFDGLNTSNLSNIDFYLSHEGLLLPYEEAMTRNRHDSYYNLGAHMIWLGERTRNLNDAHVEYFRGIENPIGVKISSKIKSDELINLLNIINPKNESGKVCLITRMGHENVKANLPNLIKSIKKHKKNLSWICDPMHGNTKNSKSNLKTRSFDDIVNELVYTFRIHSENESHLSGVHFELTGEHVTECIGGSDLISEETLCTNYQTYCDPRLNYNQSMEISFLIAKMLKTAQ